MANDKNTHKRYPKPLFLTVITNTLFISFSLLLFIFSTKVYANATHSSLFFTQGEMQEIDAIKKNMPRKKNTSTRLHLSAIMYQNDTQWTVWINGEAWNHKTINDGVKVHQINPKDVTLSIIDSSGAESFVTLKLNQSYNKLTNSIEENYE